MSAKNRALWKQHCKKYYVPFRARPEWFDLVCGIDNWSVACVTNSGEVVAALPYPLPTDGFISTLRMPIYTTYLHLFLSFPERCSQQRIAHWERQYITELADQLPKASRTAISLAPDFDFWLPFRWLGFRQTTRYTYQLTQLQSSGNVASKYKGSLRTDIRKAKANVSIQPLADYDAFIELLKKTYSNKNIPINWKPAKLKNILQFCIHSGNAELLGAYDANGRLHAAVCTIYDEQRAALVITASDALYRSSGAVPFLIDTSINHAKKNGCSLYDFEGSMDKGMEHFLSSFGGKRYAYHYIYRNKYKLLDLLELIRS